MASMAVATSSSKIFLFRRHSNKEVTSRMLGNHAHTIGSTARVRIHCKQPDQSTCSPLKYKPWWRISDARENGRSFVPASALSPESEDLRVSTSSYEGITVTATTTGSRETKIRIDVSGAKTQAIFDDVFAKMVEAAQPIPGFRRVKGGKTPNVPRDALMQILGPYEVYKQVIKKVIDSTVADYVKKENLKVTKDLKVEQSFEELEETFEPGQEFSFDAVIQLKEMAASNS